MGGRGGSASFSDIFSDVFGDIFGGGRRSVSRGSDLRYTLELDLEQAVSGDTSKSVCRCCRRATIATAAVRERYLPGPVPRMRRCEGQIRVSQGFFSLQQTCPRCRGAGSISKILAALRRSRPG